MNGWNFVRRNGRCRAWFSARVGLRYRPIVARFGDGAFVLIHLESWADFADEINGFVYLFDVLYNKKSEGGNNGG